MTSLLVTFLDLIVKLNHVPLIPVIRKSVDNVNKIVQAPEYGRHMTFWLYLVNKFVDCRLTKIGLEES